MLQSLANWIHHLLPLEHPRIRLPDRFFTRRNTRSTRCRLTSMERPLRTSITGRRVHPLHAHRDHPHHSRGSLNRYIRTGSRTDAFVGRLAQVVPEERVYRLLFLIGSRVGRLVDHRES
jgi:hypothetical protein